MQSPIDNNKFYWAKLVKNTKLERGICVIPSNYYLFIRNIDE